MRIIRIFDFMLPTPLSALKVFETDLQNIFIPIINKLFQCIGEILRIGFGDILKGVFILMNGGFMGGVHSSFTSFFDI